MIVIEGFDTGIQYRFSSANDLLEFLDGELPSWWMEGGMVVTPRGPAYIHRSYVPELDGEQSQSHELDANEIISELTKAKRRICELESEVKELKGVIMSTTGANW